MPAENADQVRAFLARHAGFAVVPPLQVVTALWDKAEDFAAATRQGAEGLLMTPRRTETDGFFVSVLSRRGAAAVEKVTPPRATERAAAEPTVTEW